MDPSVALTPRSCSAELVLIKGNKGTVKLILLKENEGTSDGKAIGLLAGITRGCPAR